MDFWANLWNIFWWFIWVFAFIAYLMVLWSILSDLFRDKKLNGWLKAVWIVFLVFLPFITALVYLIGRGRGMAERGAQANADAQRAGEAYIRSVAGTAASPAAEIERAQALLAAGAISQDEFDQLKAKALG